MPLRYSRALSLLATVMVFSACKTPPPLSPARPQARVPKSAPAVILPPGVTISPVQRGDAAVPFAQSASGERTFPNNLIGANLAFTANLRMPKLDAVVLDQDRYELRMRFSNATKEPLYVTLDCVYEGDTRAAKTVRSIEFPMHSFRDITMAFDGDPTRKVHVRASAGLDP